MIKQKIRNKYYILYTLFFAAIAFLIFLPFVINGQSFCWRADGLILYYMKARYVNATPLFSQLFDFSMGMGSDVFGIFLSLFFNPIKLITTIWPSQYFEVYYTVLVLVSFYISGITFSVFAKRFSNSNISRLIGALVYAFSGYIIFTGVRHPYFVEIMAAMLPLLLLGVEKILNRERIYNLVIVVFALSALSIYYLYICTILAVFYFIVRFFDINRKSGRAGHRLKEFLAALGKTALAYLTGVAMGAVSWLPTFFTYAESGRIGETVGSSLWLYSLDYYKNVFLYLFTGKEYIGEWTVLGFSSICLIFTTLLFIKKEYRKKHRSLIGLLILGTVALCIPAFGYLCSGLSNVNNRWSFGYAVVIAMIAVVVMEDIKKVSERDLILVSCLFALYAVACWAVGAKLRHAVSFIIIAAALVLMFILVLKKDGKYRKWLPYAAGALTIVSIILNAYMVYSPSGDDYVSEFEAAGEVENTLLATPLTGLKEYLTENEDNSFFRVNTNATTTLTGSSGILLGLNTVSDFDSADTSYNGYLYENENASLQYLANKLGMDNRTAMLETAGVKYYAVYADDKYPVPFGYTEIAEIENDKGENVLIFKNENALSLGYSYDSYITRAEYDKLSPLDKQNALLQSALIEDESNIGGSMGITKKAVTVDSLKNDILSVEYNDVELEDGVLKVAHEGAGITYKIASIPGELYVHITGHHRYDNSELWIVLAETEKSSVKIRFYGEGNTYYIGPDKLGNLGYLEEGTDEVTLSFSAPGTYTLENVEFFTQPMDSYNEYVTALGETQLEEYSRSRDIITGTVCADRNKIMCLSIPYNTMNGWKVYIDDKETDLFRCNSMYLGFVLPEGNHSVRLEYNSPGIKICGIISGLSMCIFILVWILYEKKIKKFQVRT